MKRREVAGNVKKTIPIGCTQVWNPGPYVLFIALFVSVLSLAGCGGESEEMARKKLEVILKDDLAASLEGIAADKLLDTPYYDLVSYEKYTKGKYTIKAIADFYFLKNVRVKIVRKYRYLESSRMWDRYYNEYKFLPDPAALPDSASK